MNEIITSLFGKNFAPHGYCLAWDDNLLALHVISDLSIFLAYMLIPVFLGIYLFKKGRTALMQQQVVLGLFALFILGCGFTHLIAVITIWQPWYYFEGIVKVLTAVVSITTAGYLYSILPKLIQMQGIDEILENNQRLKDEILLRQQKEAELLESQTELKSSKSLKAAILDNIVDGIITIDNRGLILSINKAAEVIFQYSAAEIIGKNVKMLMPPPYAEQHDSYLLHYLTTGERKIIGIGREVIGLCRDGSTFPMELAVSEVSVNHQRVFSGIVRNITERKQAELANKHFEAIIQSSDDAIISKTLDGIITSWNPGAEAIFGYAADEVIGKPMLMLIPDHRKEEESLILNRIKQGEKVDHFETIRLRKDGTAIDISATISPMYDKNGKVIGASKIARNITEEKKAQVNLLEAKKAAEVASRAKSEFLANMSHEIRTPLNGVIGMIELVIDTELDPKQLRFLKIANESAALLLNVINDILDFSKIEAKKLDLSPHPFNVRDSIDNTISTLAMRAHDKKLELVCSVSPNIPEILIADNVRVQQVLHSFI
jgi:PAS domain S-box-containing protein